MSGRLKFADLDLPQPEMWKNTLDNGKISISSQELEKAKHMWEIFECRTKQDYRDCYLMLDVALLACWSEYCRKLSYQIYSLDVAQFFTAPNLAKYAALRKAEALADFSTQITDSLLYKVELDYLYYKLEKQT